MCLGKALEDETHWVIARSVELTLVERFRYFLPLLLLLRLPPSHLRFLQRTHHVRQAWDCLAVDTGPIDPALGGMVVVYDFQDRL